MLPLTDRQTSKKLKGDMYINPCEVCYLEFLGPLISFVLLPSRWTDRRLVNSTAEAQDDGGICKRGQGTEGGGGVELEEEMGSLV
jgi:hypothetical protein